jgi:hypothetical protein
MRWADFYQGPLSEGVNPFQSSILNRDRQVFISDRFSGQYIKAPPAADDVPNCDPTAHARCLNFCEFALSTILSRWKS